MSILSYNHDKLFIENVAVNDIATKYGTPCYVYSEQAISDNWHAYYNALKNTNIPFKIHYAVKANSNLSILRLLAKHGASFDVVSGGEIDRVLAAGGNAHDIIFAGVGKTAEEIQQAIALDIFALHVESTAELLRIHEIAKKNNKRASIAIRINPDIEAHTHKYISTGNNENKFGIDCSQALDLYLQAKTLPNIHIKGIACHIGSQITTLDPYIKTVAKIKKIIAQLNKNNIPLEYIDVGGGLGICYKDEKPPTPQEFINTVVDELKQEKLAIHIEPGRSIIANAGILLTKVEYIKTTPSKKFAIVDAAMNDLIRPALYQSYHEILPVNITDIKPEIINIVGPVCESGDFLALDRLLAINEAQLLAIKDCGAYGFSMSSNYNTRPRCAEVLVHGANMQLIRKRETISQLLQNEQELLI